MLGLMSDMGAGELGIPSKTTKTSTPQEKPPSNTSFSYPEWTAAFQAYYGTGTMPLPPPGYFPPTVGSGPQTHPHMWGGQPLMTPYGTPPPYAAMYPHGYPHAGMYAHPSMAPGTHPFSPYNLATGNANDAQGGAASAGTDVERKSTDGKKKSPMKRSKGSLGSLGMLTGKGNDVGKGNTGSMNGAFTHSGDSGSEGSLEGSEGDSKYDSQGGRRSSFDHATSEAHVVNSTALGSGHEVHPVPALPISIAGKQVVGAGPLTNLNIGMDYWSGGASAVLANSQGKLGAVTATAMVRSPNMVGSTDLWLQDERELKRQRRKQSNRESARRSRLRKQAECEELAARVETLNTENLSLRSELAHVTERCKKLSAENTSLLEQLQGRRAHSEGSEAVLTKNGTYVSGIERRDLDENLHLENGTLRKDARETKEMFTLSGSSNVGHEGGSLAIAVSSC